MKKIMMTLAAGRLVLTIVLCCAMTATMLMSCSDNGKDGTTHKIVIK